MSPAAAILCLFSYALGYQVESSQQSLHNTHWRRPSPSPPEDLDTEKLRFGVYKVPTTTHVPNVAVHSYSASPDSLPPEAPRGETQNVVTSCEVNWSGTGACTAGDCQFPQPPFPPQSSWSPPLPNNGGLSENGSIYRLQCNTPYQLDEGGSNGVQCKDNMWTGGDPLARCVCSRPTGWCYDTPSKQWYTRLDIDGDKIPDHLCQEFTSSSAPYSSSSGGSGTLKASVIKSTTNCQSQENVAITTYDPMFGVFRNVVSGACEGLWWDIRYTTFSACAASCAQDTSCETFAWSNSLQQCYVGRAVSCTSNDPNWLGGSKVCIRPSTWCMNSNDMYQRIDCDSDNLLDHVCVNGNVGGRIASMSGCTDNWPNAVNDDCHPGFD